MSEPAVLTIRPFTPSDPDLDRIGRTYCAVFGLDWEAEKPGVLRYRDPSHDFRGLTAYAGDELVGVAWGIRTCPGEWLYDHVVTEIGHEVSALVDAWVVGVLAVSEGYRCQGIGGRLHDALLAAQPWPRALISTDVRNEVARRFYERRGWRYFESGGVIDTGKRRLVVMWREMDGPQSGG